MMRDMRLDWSRREGASSSGLGKRGKSVEAPGWMVVKFDQKFEGQVGFSPVNKGMGILHRGTRMLGVHNSDTT